MPIYEYVCNECDAEFEQLVFGEQVPACPSCSGIELSKRMSVTARGVVKGASAAPSEACGTCPGRSTPGCPVN